MVMETEVENADGFRTVCGVYPVEEVGCFFVACIPGLSWGGCSAMPVRWGKRGVEADKVCDTFDESSWTCTFSIVLETVDDFVCEYTHDFVSCAMSVFLYPVKGEVDFFVGIATACVCYALHWS